MFAFKSKARRLSKVIARWCLGLSCLAAACANAAPVTLSGDHFDVLFDSEEAGLFGTPQLSGNTLFFTPTSFYAEAFAQHCSDLIRETIHLTIRPHQGVSITGVSAVERGDYFTRGERSNVHIDGQIRLRAINDPLTEWSGFFDRTDNDDDATEHNGVYRGNWESVAQIDEGFSIEDPLILTLENLLFASVRHWNGLAFIEKKFVGIPIDFEYTAAVPLPAALPLFGSGLLLLWGIRARRRAISDALA